MTDEQLSKAIAEKLGWSEIVHHPVLGFVGKPPGYWKGPVLAGGVIPDAVNNAAMTLHVAENLVRNCTHLVLQHWPDGVRLDVHRYGSQPDRIAAEHIGGAIAEAFAKVNGIWRAQ